jgi:uncharacterized protein YecE (DUF72 family)
LTKVFIGTSGWAYKEWGEKFFPEDLPQREHLPYLAERFNSVELNASFYRIQPERNYRKWYQETPKGFQFAIKVSRFITHRKEPVDVREPWRRLAVPSRLLEEKRGPFLWQFPPSFRLPSGWLDWLESTLAFVTKEEPGSRHAFEFRHTDCFRGEVFKTLQAYGAVPVVANSSRFPTSPTEGEGEFVYYRLHGPRELFASSYDPEELRPWAERAARALDDGKDVYAYFNNDMHGYAPENARMMREQLEQVSLKT